MALPKMTCPISQARREQINKFWKEKSTAEVQFLWENEQEDILKVIPELGTLRKLAKYNIPEVKVIDQLKIVEPDTLIDFLKPSYFEQMEEATSDTSDSWSRPNLTKWPVLGECVRKVFNTMTSTEVPIPSMVVKGSRKLYSTVRTILLTEKTIRHIFEAEKVYLKYNQNTSKERNNTAFWKEQVYRKLFDFDMHYQGEDNFNNLEIKCNLAEYFKKTLRKFEEADTVAEVNYFSPSLGLIDGISSANSRALIFLLVKSPEVDGFEQRLKDLRIRNTELKEELDNDVRNSSVFRTLANKPKGKLWLKYFSLAEVDSDSSIYYSKEAVQRALKYLKGVYNSHWYATMQSPDLAGITADPGISVYTSFFARTKIFQELLPWLAMIKRNVDEAPQIHDLQALHEEYPDLPTYSNYFISFGVQDYNDHWQTDLRLRCKFEKPVCAVGARYFCDDNIDFRAYTGDWSLSTTSVLGPAYSYFEKMPLLSEVINELSMEIRKFEKALGTVNKALKACRKAQAGLKILQTEEDLELEEIIWDGLRDYFEVGDDPMVKGFELETTISNPFQA